MIRLRTLHASFDYMKLVRFNNQQIYRILPRTASINTVNKQVTRCFCPGSSRSDEGNTEGNRSTIFTRQSKKKDRRTSNRHEATSAGTRELKIPEICFEEYINEDECTIGLNSGELISGAIRINQKNYKYAFVNNTEGGERDINIDGVQLRNRALPGDIVVVKIFPENQWKKGEGGGKHGGSYAAKTGKVVRIIEKKHSRVASGYLKPFLDHQLGFALFSPLDSRLPRIMIPLEECPKDFRTQHKDLENTLFACKITDWGNRSEFATGQLVQELGQAGLIEPETEAILMEHDIDSSEFKDEVVRCLPDGKKWKVTREELAKRKDFRKDCILSIDPSTARDLDDALSCNKLGDDLFEVGVHIADVSHFVDEGNALDKVAARRATSVYLRQKVIPMLPRVLCEDLCSLNPGVERLAYSVKWTMKADGTIVNTWFGRSVIRSCVQLSYDHAQHIIDSQLEDLKDEDFPSITGNFSLAHISSAVKDLHAIAQRMRKKRFKSGALSISNQKLDFTLDSEEGTPNGCRVYEYRKSNELIEEFMLLANISVAKKIFTHDASNAILRHHPPPDGSELKEALMGTNLIDEKTVLDDETMIKGSFKKSLNKLLSSASSKLSENQRAVLNLKALMSFKLAEYYCADGESKPHYGLNVPLYTHFTSPIRRYPDVLVHRCLTAALDENYKTNSNVQELKRITSHCNDKKYNAKQADEKSSLLFLAVFLRECGPQRERGVVVEVKDRSVDVLASRLGHVITVHCDQLEKKYSKKRKQLTLFWKREESGSEQEESGREEDSSDDFTEQKVGIASLVDIIVSAKPVNKWKPDDKLTAEFVNPHEDNDFSNDCE